MAFYCQHYDNLPLGVKAKVKHDLDAPGAVFMLAISAVLYSIDVLLCIP